MTVRWLSYLCLAGLLAIVMGCRTTPPNLKPPKSPENLVDPPQEARYDTSEYPKAAFDDPKRLDTIDKALAGTAGKAGGMGGLSGAGPGGH